MIGHGGHKVEMVFPHKHTASRFESKNIEGRQQGGNGTSKSGQEQGFPTKTQPQRRRTTPLEFSFTSHTTLGLREFNHGTLSTSQTSVYFYSTDVEGKKTTVTC